MLPVSQLFATRSAKYSVGGCRGLQGRFLGGFTFVAAQARPAGARPEVSELIRALLSGLAMVVATAMRALGARNHAFSQVLGLSLT